MFKLQQLQEVLSQTLDIDTTRYTSETPLLGAVPELDSMAIVTLVMAIEQEAGISMMDDELNAEKFASVGDLLYFINQCKPA
ncbi:acyl carrier protein [Paraneptunicella aestuarii]|uniref:acyl carrier protein n=1 Tax=Paraneptunicella aestuarii TaxID=2831148 RepID=UPI001E4BFC0E|nr:phosphopantetheine-binding protein [Paraneptunicella aestuarii]UAA39266.1 acyl carrier protein [Paraneptunicella aestuarii]